MNFKNLKDVKIHRKELKISGDLHHGCYVITSATYLFVCKITRKVSMDFAEIFQKC